MDRYIQGGSNMTETDLCVKKTALVPVIFKPPCTCCTVYVSTRTAVHLLHCTCQHTDRYTLALYMSAHGPLYTCTVHVSTQTAIHLLHCTCQHKTCSSYVNFRSSLWIKIMPNMDTPDFSHPAVCPNTCQQRPYPSRIFMKFDVNVITNLLNKPEFRENLLIGNNLLLRSFKNFCS
jgi:hypothetical protein